MRIFHCALRVTVAAVKKRSMSSVPPLVSAEWLKGQLTNPEVRLLEACGDGGDAYKIKHIPSAVVFDIPTMSDKTSAYKNMLPTAEQFADYVTNQCGIGNHHHVVVYDASDEMPTLLSAARCWMMFRIFGHSRVSVLDGGLRHWALHHETTDKPTTVSPSDQPFKATFRPELVWSFEQVVDNVKKADRRQVVDARAASAYKGEKPPPGCTNAGHIKGALSTPSTTLLDGDTKLWKSADALKAVFGQAGVNLSAPITTSCGTAMSACAAALGAFIAADNQTVAIYDGSFFEFDKRAPKELIVAGDKP